MFRKKHKTEEIKQLDLGLKLSFWNNFTNFKTRVYDKLVFFEANKFINDPLIWLFTTLIGVGTVFQLVFILEKINTLPDKIPLLNYSLIPDMILTWKLYILTIPLLSLILFIISFRLARNYYYKNNQLTYYLLFISALFVTILSYHIIKVIISYV